MIRTSSSTRTGFTVIEMMIAVGIIIVLLSIVLVAVNAGAQASRRASTVTLMGSISQALVQFREDVGYLPPVLDEERRLVDARGPDGQPNTADDLDPRTNGNFSTAVQDWWSVTTLAEYLVGYGHHREDGFGYVPPDEGGPLFEDERPPLGIRWPMRDGVWGASYLGDADGSVEARNPLDPATSGRGQRYGPYLELKSNDLLLAITPEGGVVGPRERDDFDDLPKVLVDAWGQPIRYYRRYYPAGGLGSEVRPTDYLNAAGVPGSDGLVDPLPTLSEVIVLRPFRPQEDGSVVPDAKTYRGQPIDLTTYGLQTAEFALLSSGPDRSLTADERFDQPDELNKDNIVELGP